jgi:hypothetical protein
MLPLKIILRYPTSEPKTTHLKRGFTSLKRLGRHFKILEISRKIFVSLFFQGKMKALVITQIPQKAINRILSVLLNQTFKLNAMMRKLKKLGKIPTSIRSVPHASTRTITVLILISIPALGVIKDLLPQTSPISLIARAQQSLKILNLPKICRACHLLCKYSIKESNNLLKKRAGDQCYSNKSRVVTWDNKKKF